MVRVIDPGPVANVAKKVVCRHCGALLEYVPNDVKEYHGRDISGGPDGIEWVDCHQCSKKAVIRAW